MITKSRLKVIKSLSRKKNRDEHQLFVVEGYKSIQELSQTHFKLQQLLVTQDSDRLNHLSHDVISQKEMQSISSLKTPPGYLAVFEMSQKTEINTDGLIVALDDIKDPGNLGTIIRLCDWFHVKHILCSRETVDVYNPKSVQASMASLGRVHVHYVDLETEFKKLAIPVYPTAMDGTSIYEMQLPDSGIVVMGNESIGVHQEILDLGKDRLSIPQYGNTTDTESLNVAMATAVILSEWRRSTGM